MATETCNQRIVSRDDAKAAGLKRYFTGEPCRNGHVAERLVSAGKCVDCDKAKKEKKRRAAGAVSKPQGSCSAPGLRRDAARRGSTRYFTGIACSHGHVADRLVSSGHCVTCHNIRIAKREQRKEDAAIAARTLTKILGVPHEVVGDIDANGRKDWQPRPMQK